MKSINSHIRKTLIAAIVALSFSSAIAADLGPTIDDFSNTTKNTLGIDRQYMDDSLAGGQTKTTYSVKDGVISAKGEIAPPRGQPGWASMILLLDGLMQPQDASAYTGIRMLVRVNEGNLAISANSSEITNFDYHAAPVVRSTDGEFHEVKIPFADMKRAWSEQTPLNLKTLVSLSLVSVNLQKGAFDYEVKEVAFY